MARDVEFAVTASDKTGAALASAEAKFRASQERIRRESKKTGDGVGDDLKKGVDKAAPGILGKLKSTFGLAGTSGGELLAIGLVAASPVIGAAISAAIIGGAGVGGVIGGVILASKDPRVAAAGTALGQKLTYSLQQDAGSFVDPILENIGKIEGRFEQMNTRIKRIFDNSSGFLDPLVNGALDAVDGILRGVDALVAKAGPVMKALGKSFGIIGNDIGDAMEIVSGDSDDAASALTTLATATGELIKVGAYLIRGLTELYGIITYLPGKFHDAEAAVAGFFGVSRDAQTAVAGTATNTAALAVSVAESGQAAAAAAGPVATFTDKVNNLANAGRSAFDATTSVGEATDRVTKAVKDNGKTLDAHTEKGRENRTALSNLASALVAQYNATVEVNGEGIKSNGVAKSNRDTFARLAAQFGLTKTQAANLATQMGLIPAKKNTDFHANTHDAEARIKALQDRVAATHGKTIEVHVSVTGTERLDNLGHRIGGYSSAGMSWAGTDRNSGVARTGGPTPVNVSSNVAVSLDGTPFYAMTVRASKERSDRDAWRQKVGRRK
jgi:hypothetical protein